MSLYTFEKKIPINTPIEKIKNVSFYEDLKHLIINSNLRIQGKIKCNVDCELKDSSTKRYEDDIEIDLFLKQEDLMRNESKLTIDNYSYDFDENNIILHISCVLQEDNTMDTNLQSEDSLNRKNLLEPLKGDLNEEEIKELEELFKEKDVEVISTFTDNTFLNEYTREQKVEDTKFEMLNEKEEMEEKEEQKKECDNKKDYIMNENIYNEPIIIEQVQEDYEKVKEEKNEDLKKESECNNKKQSKNILLIEEGYSIFASFYRVISGDSYQSISLKNKCDLQQLMNLNNNTELKQGMLIRIPKND